MRIKAIKNTICGSALFALTFISCNGCKSLCTGYSSFALTGGEYTLSPTTDSIKVGDTLWLSAMIPTSLKYRNGTSIDSSVYDLSGASNVTTDLHMTVLQQKGFALGGIDSFQLLTPKIGRIAPNALTPSTAQTVYFVEDNGMFSFSLGFVAQKKGIYAFSMVDIFQAVKNCDHASVSLILNNTENHQYYLQSIYYGGAPIAPIDETHSYCFKVY